jgi:hypothetical protein
MRLNVRETLQLERLETGTYRLTRILSLPDGLRATLSALGSEPSDMLPRFNEIEPSHQFQWGPGYRIARSYELEQDWRKTGAEASRAELIFTRGVARTDALQLAMTLPSTRGVAADITLEAIPTDGQTMDLPEDLLAVLGWDWVGLVRTPAGWKSRLRLRGEKARRSRGAENALKLAASHLVRTLAEPPARFHERWARTRWGVVFRRSIPLLTTLTLIGGIAALPHFVIDRSPRIWTLLFDVPTVLIALSFCLQEQAQYEIPPLPRRSAAPAWRRPQA